MTSDLILSLGIENNLPLGKFLLATKDDKSDLGFVLADTLGYLLKKNYSLLLINLAQSFNHYHHLLAKTGTNLTSLKESGRVVIIDVLSFVPQLLDVTPSSGESKDHILSFDGRKIEISEMYNLIETAVGTLKTQDSTGFILCIDEINILLNLGVSSKSILKFLHYCRVLSVEQNGFLIVGGQLEPYDHESFRFLTYLAHVADMSVHVQGLSTGYSKDIHGKLWCRVREKNEEDGNKVQIPFKVEEKGTKFLRIGE